MFCKKKLRFMSNFATNNGLFSIISFSNRKSIKLIITLFAT